MRRLGLILLVLGAAPPVDAQAPPPDTQYGNVRFRVPDGWEKVDKGNQLWLVPRNLPQGKVAALMIGSEPLASDLRAWARGAWAQMQAAWTVERGGEIKAARPLSGHETVSVENWLAEKQNAANRFYSFTQGAKNGSRVETFQYITNAEELRQQHEAALRPFYASLSFAPPPASAPAPPPSAAMKGPAGDLYSPSFTWGAIAAPQGSGGLDGIYGALLMQNSIGTYQTYITPRLTYWTFFPDGHFYAALPDEGLENFNYAYWHQKNPVWCGTYQLSGDTGVLTYDDDRHTVRKLRKVRGGVEIDNTGPYKLVDRCNGIRLEGTYKRSDWQTLSPNGKAAFIAFSRDGRFEEQGILGLTSVSWWRPGQRPLEPEAIPGKGTYEISNNSLSLVYDDGRKRRVNFHLGEKATRDRVDAFLINTWTLARQ